MSDGICRQVEPEPEPQELDSTDVEAANAAAPLDAPILTAGAILKCSGQDTDLYRLYVQEWGGWVYARPWSGTERKTWGLRCERAAESKNEKRLTLLTAELIALSLCDEQGHRIFKLEEADKINELSGTVLDRVEDWILRINGLRGEPDLEAAEKNSASTQSDGSSTD